MGEWENGRMSEFTTMATMAGMRQSHPKCKIFGQARRSAPTKACRGDPLWSPAFRKSDFDVALLEKARKIYRDRGIGKKDYEQQASRLTTCSCQSAILILPNVGATTESCPYKSGKYLRIIGDFKGCRGGSPCPPG
jgi:hypothetical protein